MNFKNFNIGARPVFDNVYCPKCKQDMKELPDGWFSCVWYCEKCKNVFTLKLSKISDKNIDKKILEKLIEEK